jgi:flavodoxin
MKSLVVYSSLTGNTKMVAEAIAEELGKDTKLVSVEEEPAVDGYDLVAIGFWVDRGTADQKTAIYLQTLNHAKIALFATLGANPNSEHAKKSLDNAAKILDETNTVVGRFICQGKVDPKLIEQMNMAFPAGHSHGMNEERRARHEVASKHPDAQDLIHAKQVFAQIKKKLARQ